MKITAAIITNQVEVNKFLLESLSFVDEIVIVIDSSTPSRHCEEQSDAAISLHKTPLYKTFYHPLNNNFAAQRNFALTKVTSDWVLFVDSDEYVGQELVRQIRTAITSDKFQGYRLNRLDVVFHQPLRHGETGHTQILRLARKNAGKFVRPVHEIWQIKGRVGELESPLYHIKDSFVSEFIGRIGLYGSTDSRILTIEGKPFSYFRLFFYPKAKFFLNYFFKLGFLDGLAGFFQAYLMSVQSLSVRIFQWEENH